MRVREVPPWLVHRRRSRSDEGECGRQGGGQQAGAHGGTVRPPVCPRASPLGSVLAVSTRRLIIAALLCGLAILLAFALQLLLVL